MKKRITGARGLSLAALLLALPAAAATVAPAGPFAATGKLALSKGPIAVSCLTTFTGTVTADGLITVKTLTFSGGLLCGRISALGLPWTGQAVSATQLTLEGMQVDIHAPLLGGRCGPVNVSAGWDNARAAAHFDKVALPPNCSMDGTLISSPTVVITP